MLSSTPWRAIPTLSQAWLSVLMDLTCCQTRWTTLYVSGMYDLSLLKNVVSKWWLAMLTTLKRYTQCRRISQSILMSCVMFRIYFAAHGHLTEPKFQRDLPTDSFTFGTLHLAASFTNYLVTTEVLMTLYFILRNLLVIYAANQHQGHQFNSKFFYLKWNIVASGASDKLIYLGEIDA
jgi:hypothetical protein